jgi:hypothetical protein
MIDHRELAALAGGDQYDLAAAQVETDVAMAKARLADQHPDLAPPEWRTRTS